MKKFVMLVGLPASGKSTWATKQIAYLEKNNISYVVISSDDYIEAKAAELGKTYAEVFSQFIGDAGKNMMVVLKQALADGVEFIIWDQTNLDVKTRGKKLALVPDDYTKSAVIFDRPEDEEWDRRLNSRPGKTIPRHILDAMESRVVHPTFDENFDEIALAIDVQGSVGLAVARRNDPERHIEMDLT